MDHRTDADLSIEIDSTPAQYDDGFVRHIKIPAALIAGAFGYWALYTYAPFFSGLRILELTPFAVGAFGYFFGLRAGFLASIGGLVAHTVILNQHGFNGWLVIADYQPVAHVCILLIGPVLGRLRTTGARLAAEVRRRRTYEQAVRAGATFHRSILETMDEGVLHADNRDVIVYCNRRLSELTGYAPDELIGRRPAEVLLSGDDQTGEFLRRQVEERRRGDPGQYRLPVRRKSGETVWMDVTASPMRDADGVVVGAVSVFSDVTAQVDAEQELMQDKRELTDSLARYRELVENLQETVSQREQQLRAFVEHTPAAVAMFDKKMNYLMASRSWLMARGLADVDVVGQNHYELEPEFAEEWRSVHARVLTGAAESRAEDAVRRSDGGIDWFRWSMQPWFEREDTIGGVMVFCETITREVQARERVRRSEIHHRSLVGSLPGVITGIDVTGNILFVNNLPDKLAPEDVVGRSVYAFFPEEQNNDFRAAIEAAVRTREPTRYDSFAGTPPQRRWWSNRIVPVVEHGAVVRLILIGQPISQEDLGERERQLLRPREEAPVETPPAIAAATRTVYFGPSEGSETILLVEDATRAGAVREVLESKGYHVLAAGDGEEALRICAEHNNGTIDLLVTDLVMPRMDGRELASRVRERQSDLKVLYISGFSGMAGVRVAELGLNTSVLSRPFSAEALARKARLLIDAGRRAATGTPVSAPPESAHPQRGTFPSAETRSSD